MPPESWSAAKAASSEVASSEATSSVILPFEGTFATEDRVASLAVVPSSASAVVDECATAWAVGTSASGFGPFRLLSCD